MADVVKFETKGLVQVRTAMRNLADKQVKRITRNAIHEAARKIRDDAKAEARARTRQISGELVKSIVAKRRKTFGQTVLSDVFPTVFYGRFVELGHERSGAFRWAQTSPRGRFFMRAAFEKNAHSADRIVANRMRREINNLKLN